MYNMYLYYCIIAFIAIVLTSLVLYRFMKKRNQVDNNDKVNLAACTVLTIVCATLTPIFAKLLVQQLYLSVFISVTIAFVFLIAISIFIFYFVKDRIYKVPDKEGQKDDVVLTGDSYIPGSVAEIEAASALETGHEPGGSIITDIIEKLSITKDTGESEMTGESEESIIAEVTEESTITEESKEQEETVPSVITYEKEFDSLTLEELLDKAHENKSRHDYLKAISFYESALSKKPDAELLTLMIIDLCSLYKMTNQKDLAYRILESNGNNLLNPEIKDIILQNL